MLAEFLYLLITLFSTASYVVALQSMFKGRYRPNTFSRAVWGVLNINSFVGVVVSHSTTASVILAAIMMVGSISIFIASLNSGSRTFGSIEYFCLGLLAISLIVWIAFDRPLINIAISLFAYFVGAFPTYAQVWANPRLESRKFWGLFCIASFLSVVASFGTPLTKQIVPLYFTVFDGSLFLLTLRGTKFKLLRSRD